MRFPFTGVLPVDKPRGVSSRRVVGLDFYSRFSSGLHDYSDACVDHNGQVMRFPEGLNLSVAPFALPPGEYEMTVTVSVDDPRGIDTRTASAATHVVVLPKPVPTVLIRPGDAAFMDAGNRYTCTHDERYLQLKGTAYEAVDLRWAALRKHSPR